MVGGGGLIRITRLKKRRSVPPLYSLVAAGAALGYNFGVIFIFHRSISLAAYQYIYVMKGLSKTWPGEREVLKNIHLSFLPGAKIGVLGANGAGKSTLLKIMAGVDTEFVGEAWAADGVRVGYLAQEPELNADKDVHGNVMEGMSETKECLIVSTTSAPVSVRRCPTMR